MAEFKTERLHLGGWRPEGAAPLAVMNADPEVMRHIGSGVRTSERALDEARAFLSEPPPGPLGLWAIRDLAGDGFLGWAALVPLDGGEEIELGYRLVRKAWGRGLASEAGRRLLEHGFEDLALARIAAVTARANTASQRVLCKLGFQYRGLREVYGVQGVWYYSISAGAWARLARPG